MLGGESDHGGPEYERLVHREVLILQLHRWEVEHHHGAIGDPTTRPYGNGVLLWFETDAFDAAVARATELRAEVVLAPHVNPNAGHREIWLRDLDGYTVVLASPAGDLA